MNIKNVTNIVANIRRIKGGKGDNLKIDAIVSGASTSAIEIVMTYTGANVSRPIAVDVKRASLNSFRTGILVSILQIYVFTGLTMNVLRLNGQDEG